MLSLSNFKYSNRYTLKAKTMKHQKQTKGRLVHAVKNFLFHSSFARTLPFVPVRALRYFNALSLMDSKRNYSSQSEIRRNMYSALQTIGKVHVEPVFVKY